MAHISFSVIPYGLSAYRRNFVPTYNIPSFKEALEIQHGYLIYSVSSYISVSI